MPDLMTHLAATHLARRTWEGLRGRDLSRRESAMLYLGGCLPDLLSRVPGLAMGGLYRAGLVPADLAARAGDVAEMLHAPVPTALAAYALVMLLPAPGRTRYFALLAAGCGLHWLLDLLQATLGAPGTFWLYPFSLWSLQLGLFWPDTSIVALPWLGAAIVIVECLRRRFKHPAGAPG